MSISNWLDNYILANGEFKWLSEKKIEFLSTIINKIDDVTTKETPVLILTDKKREWFAEYIVESINTKSKHRPFLPFHNINKIFKNKVEDEYTINLFGDMLSSSFDNYILLYVGEIESLENKFAMKENSSIIWSLGKGTENSFYLDKNDKFLDMKLISLFMLFDEIINAYMFDDNE